MKLNVGESKTVKLHIWLKAIDFDCAGNSLRLEASKGSMWLYANNGSRRHYYCAMPLGGASAMRKHEYTIKAQSKSRVLFSVGQVKFVIDFAAKKAATNLVGYRITGSKEWGENCQIPWRAEFLPLFGIPMPPAEMIGPLRGCFGTGSWRTRTPSRKWPAKAERKLSSFPL